MTTIETVIQKAIETYGADLQKQAAIVEMSALTKEICKDFRGKAKRENIIEEIANVQIMLYQLMAMYNISDTELSITLGLKITRLDERLKEKQNG